MPRRYFHKGRQEWVTYNYYKPTGRPAGRPRNPENAIKAGARTLPADRQSRIQRLIEQFQQELREEAARERAAAEDAELDELLASLDG